MTNKELKLAKEWEHGTITSTAKANDAVDYNDEDTISGIDSVPRVIYLRTLGYTIDSWEGYAQAEINEMGTLAAKKVA